MKTYLTKEVFLNIKNRKTNKFGNTLRATCLAAVENQSNRIGCYLPDAEAYETFQSLTNPIIEEINQGITVKNFKYSKEMKIQRDCKISQEIQFVKTFKLKIKRNLEGFAFNLVNSSEIREKIKEKVAETLRKLGFDRILAVDEMLDEEKKKFWINHKAFFNNKRNPFIKQGTRYKEWPKGRALAMNSEKT